MNISTRIHFPRYASVFYTLLFCLFLSSLWLVTACFAEKLTMTLLEERSAGSRIMSATIEGRALTIYLPPGYDSAAKKSAERFPSVYFYDGQDAFSGLGIAQILDDAIAAKRLKPMIVVGVHSTMQRTSETVPYDDPWIQANWGRYTPRASEFADLLVKRVIPAIDEQFYTDKRSENRAIMGFSLGGLFAGWCGVKYPETFGTAVCFSPSFWVADDKFFADAQSSTTKPQRFRFDVGATTGEWNYYVPLIGVLKGRGMVYGENLMYYEDPQGRHDAASWRERLPDALLMFAGTKNISQDSIASWKVETEVIASASTPGRFFLRMNPIVTLQSGLRYSLATEAAYKLVNEQDGALASDGRFEFRGTRDLEVDITYKHLQKRITISYADVQRRMGR
ncbi:MAG: esterase family protein [Candidatus Kapabacteria bacterium]|nr:esterase family protein [Candidatus Kapabacteria bacterium]